MTMESADRDLPDAKRLYVQVQAYAERLLAAREDLEAAGAALRAVADDLIRRESTAAAQLPDRNLGFACIDPGSARPMLDRICGELGLPALPYLEKVSEVFASGRPALGEVRDAAAGIEYVAAPIPGPSGSAELVLLALRKQAAESGDTGIPPDRSPSPDAGHPDLAEFIDIEAIQQLMDDFYRLTRITTAIIDPEGRVLVASGWQDICTKFHRVHPESRKNCIESDTVLSRNVAPGTFRLYRCKNSMWDMVTPVMVDGRHAGNIFLGQFLFRDEVPDLEVFRSQARRYGFDEEAYLAALERVPRWSREEVNLAMTFLTRLAHLVSRSGHANLMLARSLADRERLLASLQASERRLSEIIDFLPDPTFAVDPEGRVIAWNRAMEELTGAPASEMIGKGSHEYALPYYGSRRPVLIDLALRFDDEVAKRYTRVHRHGERFEAESRTIGPRGEDRVLWIWASPLYDADGRLSGAIETIRDITERKRIEEALRESEERYRKLVEISPDMISVTVHGRLAYVNPAYVHCHGGMDASLFIGRETLSLIHPECRRQVRERMERQLRTGEPAGLHESMSVRLDGSVFHTEAAAAPLIYRGAPAVQAVVRDVTERKQAERERAVLHEKLLAAHREANLYLDIITHDIRNANNVSLGYAEMLLDLLDGDLKTYAGRLHDSIRRGTEILRNVSTIRRIREDSPGPLPVSLNEAVREEIACCPGARIRYEETDVEVLADGLLPVIFANLLGNAVKFGGPGAGIAVRVEDLGGEVLVSIEDTGPGVPDDVKERLFQRFERGRAGGTSEGLGLFIVRTLVERYGGRVWVDDRVPGRPAEGAAFRFTLRKAAREDPGG